MKIFTTEIIDEIIKKYNMGYPISRFDSIWYNRMEGVRRAGIKMSYTDKELNEYAKCYHSVKYFAETYCKIKLEDGSIGNMELRDYQKDILNRFDNRFLIEFTSRQCGISAINAIYFLHSAMFSDEPKNILLIANKTIESKELVRKIKDIYKLIPFFLKKGVTNWNEKQIIFENGSHIMTFSASKNFGVGFDVDIILIEDLAQIPYGERFFDSVFSVISKIKDSRIIIQSRSNGFNFFYDLVKKSELPEGHPEKNSFKTIRVYWWQVPGRDEKWKQEQIKMIGGELIFRQEYELAFIGYKYSVEIET